MPAPTITIVIADSTYVLRPDDTGAMREIPVHHREQLIAALEILRQQHEASQRETRAVISAARNNASLPSDAERSPTRDRMGEGDIDNLMAKLAMEEKRNRRNTIKPATIYIFSAIMVLLILLLSVI